MSLTIDGPRLTSESIGELVRATRDMISRQRIDKHYAVERMLPELSEGALRVLARDALLRRITAADRAERRYVEGVATRRPDKAEHSPLVLEEVETNLQAALALLASDTTIEISVDLLDTPFPLPDGDVVTWGDATRLDHEDRQAMFHRHVLGNLVSSARHGAVVRRLRSTRSKDLREVARKAK